jgi:hypothetical protein
MTRTPQSNRFHRLWTAVIDASATMVAIRYAAPWSEQYPSRGADDKRRCNA